ncbi:hypothetical protein [Methylorubrum suomiense]|uniref:Uncharacterized protein n=1 Tax=Methylorubrum suomiense TaxID=144191 RepID=A0ABQ4UZI3_9HYPH|nr:hypothetical protein [Methylorubrum suomiense]GJE77245.1 hypothetical protein BGCPKDLD_3848 [Methylorubrum suomiense]
MPLKSKAARHRSALSNGTTLFLGAVDGRSEAGRRYADLVDDLTAERGGREALTVGQAEAIRTYAGLAILRDRMQSDLVTGKAVDPEVLGQIGDRMARQARIMGPVKPPARPSLRDYAANKGK